MYTELSHSPASAAAVKFREVCENKYAATEAASSSERLPQTFVLGALMLWAPGAAQLVDPVEVSFDQRLVWPLRPFLILQFLKFADLGAGLASTKLETARSRSAKMNLMAYDDRDGRVMQEQLEIEARHGSYTSNSLRSIPSEAYR